MMLELDVSKVSSLGLTTDPYCIEEWTEAPEDVLSVQWSDVMIYMVTTPSPYTREEIKVSEWYEWCKCDLNQ